jgi:RHS repeat-associated protein
VHGPGSDQPLAFELYPAGADPVPGTGQAFYYHADSEGSVRLVTDAAAQVVNRYDYDSYGNRLTAIEAVWQPYTWKGREYIGGGVNVYHNRARIYDPALGRFTTEDPLGYAAGDTNLYAFGWNNPRRWNDPSGLAVSIEYTSLAQVGLLSGLYFAIACKINQALHHVQLSAAGYTNVQNELWSCLAAGTKPIAKSTVPPPYVRDARQREYDNANWFCDKKDPFHYPNTASCSLISLIINRADHCAKLYQKWDDRWKPLDHATKIAERLLRVKRYKDIYNDRCVIK